MKNKLSKAKLKTFKKLFQTKLSELNNAIQNNDEEVDRDGDEVDFVQGQVLSEINNKLSQRDVLMIQRLIFALEKIDQGIFGKCESCDELINEKRLIAIPGCSLCISCAEETELLSKSYISD